MSKADEAINQAAESSRFLGSVFDEIGNKVKYFLSLTFLVQKGWQTVKAAANQVKQLDNDMVQIGLVLGRTSSSMWGEFDNYSKMASKLNTTTSDVVAAMKLFYQQGLDTVEVNKMVEASAIAAALGETSMSEASETLTSIINSYNLSANDALNVTNKISAIAIASAADFEEMSTAIEKVAASASTAGLDLDHMMGFLAKAIETTREAPTNIGTALKTIVANFSKFQEDPNATTEDGTSINDVDEALRSVGVTLLDSEGQIRDLGPVLDELGAKWENLSRNQKSYLATMIAGTRQQSRFYAIMNDYDRTLELIKVGSGSAGTATKQFAIYEDSLTASQKKLNNELEIFYNNIANGDSLLKPIIDMGTKALNLINKINPALTALLATVGSIGVRLGVNKISSMVKDINQAIANIDFSKIGESSNAGSFIASRLSQAKQMNGVALPQTKAGDTINSLIGKAAAKGTGLNKRIKELKQLTKTSELLNTAMAQGNVTQKTANMLNAESTLALKILGGQKFVVNEANKLCIVSQTGETAAVNADTIAKMGNIVTTKQEIVVKKAQIATIIAEKVARFLSIAAIVATVAVITHLIKKEKERQKQDSKNIQMQQQGAKAAEETQKNYEALYKEYVELYNMMVKTNEELEREIELRNELAKLNPGIVAGYDEEGNAILQSVEALEEYNEKLKTETAIMNSEAAQGILNQRTGGSTRGLVTASSGVTGALVGVKAGAAIGSAAMPVIGTILGSLGGALAGAITGVVSADLVQRAVANSPAIATTIYKDKSMFNGATGKTAEDDFFLTEGLAAKAENIQDLVKASEHANEYEELLAQEYYTGAAIIAREKNDFALSLAIQEYQDVRAKEYQALAWQADQEALAAQDFSSQELALIQTLYDKKLLAQKYKTDNEIKEYLSSDKWAEYTESVRKAIGNLTDNELTKYTSLVNDIASGQYSSNFLMSQLKNVPEALRTLMVEQITAYEDSIIEALKGLNAEEEIISKEEAANYSLTSIQALSNSFNTATDQEKTTVREGLKNFKNEGILNGFLTDLENLNTNDKGEIDKFKEKYVSILGEQGEDFFKSLALGEFSFTSFKTNLPKYNTYSTTQTEHGISFSDIAQGNVDNTNALSLLEDSRTAKYVDVINGKLMVTGDLIKDSILENATKAENELSSWKDTLTENLTTAQQELEALEQTSETEMTNSQKVKQQELKTTIAGIQTQIEVTDELIKQQRELRDSTITKNESVITAASGINAITDSLDSFAEIYSNLSQGGKYSQLDIIKQIAEDSKILNAVRVNERGELELNTNAIEAYTEAKIKEAKVTVQTQIEKLEAEKISLLGSEASITAMGEEATAWSETSDAVDTATSNIATSLQKNLKNIKTWALNAIQMTQKAKMAFQSLQIQGPTQEQGVTLGTQLYNNLLNMTAVLDTSKNNNTPLSTEAQERIGEIDEQLKKLNAIKAGLENLSAKDLLQDIANGTDAFTAATKKLEHFYNYLRQIEKIESEIAKKQSLETSLNLNDNYNTSNLEAINALIAQQLKIEQQYVLEQKGYLKDLQAIGKGAYSNWLTFTDEGLLQVLKTEFDIVSESGQETYDKFSEFIELYTSQYTTELETENKLLSLQTTYVENINAAWEKTTKVLNNQLDIAKEIVEVQNSKKELQWNDTKAWKQNLNLMEAYQNQYKTLVNMEREFMSIKAQNFTELKEQSLLQFLDYNGEKDTFALNDFGLSQIEFNELAVQARKVATEYNNASTSLQTIPSQLRDINKQTKTLIENYLTEADSILKGYTSELSNIFDLINDELGELESKQDLFGMTTDTIQERFEIMANGAAMANNEMQQLDDLLNDIDNEISSKYGAYTKKINGNMFVNETALSNSEVLSDLEIAQAKMLLAQRKTIQESLTDTKDSYYNFLEKIQQLEEDKQEATIELINETHDELLSNDQKEVSDLQDKYSEMEKLDSEYYSALQQKIQDAREKRSINQEQYNIAELQNRLAITSKDTSTNYSGETRSLKAQLQEALQTQADAEIDRELERINREQKERQEDREMQIQQMQNLITFKDENGKYWEAAQELFESGRQQTESFLASQYAKEDISQAELNQKVQELNETADKAFVDLTKTSYTATAISTTVSTINKTMSEVGNETNSSLKKMTNTIEDFIKEINNDAWMEKLASYFGSNKTISTDSSKISANTVSSLTQEMKTNSTKWNKLEEQRKAAEATGDTATMNKLVAQQGRLHDSNEKIVQELKLLGVYLSYSKDGSYYQDGVKYYSTGGYVDYTGAAQVHGTASRPEAFLNAQQTALFAELRDRLSSSSAKTELDTKVASELVNISNLEISVKELADVDSIDKVIKTVKKSIYKDATSNGTVQVARR